jgi:hypothetical protein
MREKTAQKQPLAPCPATTQPRAPIAMMMTRRTMNDDDDDNVNGDEMPFL